jgi:hypothetical protein
LAKTTKPAYECLVQVKHDGKVFEPGDGIDLSDKHARPLLACKAIRAVAEEKSTAAKDSEK